MIKLIFLLLLSFNAFAGTAVITWTAPTERVDGTLLASSEIQGYEIFCYAQGAILILDKVVGNVTADTIALPSGTYSCNLQTIDTDGRRSDRSNSAGFMFTLAKPEPPVVQ